MLRQILDAHDGKLPDDVEVVFANTGKEEEATLAFVDECSHAWDVPITWLEYRDAEAPSERWRVVTFATASRHGEPFETCIRRKQFLPNPVTRFCTSELKIKAMSQYLIATHGWKEWTSVLGLRADEPRRVARLSEPNRDRDDRMAPMAVAGVTRATVLDFWKHHPFDLELPNMNGVTMHGNCDLCFLKGADQIMSLIREKPERAVWWSKMEALALASSPSGAMFRSDRPSYQQMIVQVDRQGDLFGDEPLADCFCGD